jgi:glycogen(starch) synthase
MRVLMLSWEYPPVVEGGLARHVAGLAEQLVAQGTEVHVLTRGPEETADEQRGGVNVHRVAQPAFPEDIDAFLRWVRAMNREMSALADRLTTGLEFDLVHSHDWLVADAARRSARRLERPWVVTVHATEHGRHRGWVQAHPQSVIHRAERRMTRGADHLITCSQYMGAHVSEVFGVAPAQITALRNGIDLRQLDGGTRAAPRSARAALAGPDELLVLLVGRLVHEKGFHLALAALAPLVHGHRRKRPRVRFAVAGTGTAEQELHDQARRLELSRAGTFLGWVADDRLPDLYRAADVCVVPSLYEPFGIVALEAMATGCPCIVAESGGLREIVPPGEVVGLRVAPDDVSALRGALSRILGDAQLRARLASAGREHAAGFDWPRVAEATREVYGRVLAQVPAPA